MLPLAAHFSRRSSKGEQSSKKEAPAATAPAAATAAASAAAPAAAPASQQQVAEGPPVVDAYTGESFPANQRFWTGGALHCLGAGVRVKKLGGFIPVSVYSVALYADAKAAKGAAGKHAAGAEAAATALQGGGFTQALQMRLVRSVTGKQFSDALDESLRPLMTGDEAVLDRFVAFFSGAQLDKGTEVTLLWRADGGTDVVLRPPGTSTPYSTQQPGLSVSRALGHALWQLYLGAAPPAPDARKAWLKAVAEL
ncbi:chalcone isomerase [Chlorella sorokiniana]|uniref:Chalcone isomerase n=1 Tax=Chlorella sorokiniana TaxID=3076 RepID=A0A2P6TIB9_CHLSO|nr:chalcone isomerase [Chlorella sorokiniana]|eukprot:PRW34027.1 chalcone isomerase [Chlorella sorokiniana]